MRKKMGGTRSTPDRCKDNLPCDRQEEVQGEERWELQLSHVKHRRCRNIIPDWMKRWALGR